MSRRSCPSVSMPLRTPFGGRGGLSDAGRRPSTADEREQVTLAVRAAHRQPPDRLGRALAAAGERGPVLREDDGEAVVQASEQPARDLGVVRARLPVVAVGRAEGERPVAADPQRELALAPRDVAEDALAPAAEHLVFAAVGVERADVVARGPVLDQEVARARLELDVPAAVALQRRELAPAEVTRSAVLDTADVGEDDRGEPEVL